MASAVPKLSISAISLYFVEGEYGIATSDLDSVGLGIHTRFRIWLRVPGDLKSAKGKHVQSTCHFENVRMCRLSWSVRFRAKMEQLYTF